MFRALLTFVIFASAVLASAQPLARTFSNDPAGVTLYTYPNGLRLFVAVDRSKPHVQSIIAVHAGSKNDPSDATGLAHYLEHMLFKGTNKLGTLDPVAELPMIAQIEELYQEYRRTTDVAMRASLYRRIDSVSGVAAQYAVANEYDKICQALGCSGTNAFTTTDVTAYINLVPTNKIEPYLALEAERFRAPVLRLFHTELEAVYEEKNISLDEDYSLASDTMNAALFPTHPYGTQSTLGTIQHLKNPSMKRIREYYKQYYQPSNMMIVIAGDVDPSRIAQLIDQTFGKMSSSPVPAFSKGTLAPIERSVVKNVYGQDAEWVDIAFRWPGADHPDIPALKMLDMILSNSKAGLIDLSLHQAQKVLTASSSANVMADYSYNQFSGSPLPGQRLEEVRELILREIDLVKQGAFDDWLLPAIIRDVKITQLRQLQSADGKAFYVFESLALNIPYEKYIQNVEAMSAVTKADIIRVANTYYGKNDVTVYKRTGERTDIEKVEKPTITPVVLNRDTTTMFAQEILAYQSEPIEPIFLDFERDIHRAQVSNSVQVLAVKNDENALYELTLAFRNGAKNDRYYNFVFRYFKFLSTKTMSTAALRQNEFKLGITMNVIPTDDLTYLIVTGLDETFTDALRYAETLLTDCTVDEESLKLFKERTKKQRLDRIKDKSTVLYEGLMPFALYGKNNSTLNDLSDAEIDAITPADVVARITDLTSWPHEALYWGPRTAANVATTIRTAFHQPPTTHTDPHITPWKVRPLDTPEVIVVDHDMVQAEVFMFGRSVPKYDTTTSAQRRLFGTYFDGGMGTIVFQTLRESKALAYSTGSYMQGPADTIEPYVMTGYIGTQADKLIEAIDGLRDLLHELPSIPSSLEHARMSIKQAIATDRITRGEILRSFISARTYGRKNDVRRYVYQSIDAVSMADLQSFYATAVKDRCKVIAILADVKKINIKALEKYGPVRIVKKTELFPYGR